MKIYLPNMRIPVAVQSYFYHCCQPFGLLCLILFSACSPLPEPGIIMSVDMSEAVSDSLFDPGAGDMLVLRGSFNDWAGSDLILDPSKDGLTCSGRFDVGAMIGDTIVFKFVIMRHGGMQIWEEYPDTGNPDHGNRTAVITGPVTELQAMTFDMPPVMPFPFILSSAEMREEFTDVIDSLHRYHPALYDYTKKDVLEALFERTLDSLSQERTFENYCNIINPAIAAIGCGHTKMWYPENFWTRAPQRYFPLEISEYDGGIYISGMKYRSADNIPDLPGARILSVNGKDMDELLQEFGRDVSADGFNPAWKQDQARRHFHSFYALKYGYPEVFRVNLIKFGDIRPTVIELPPVTWKEANTKKAQPSLKFTVIQDPPAGIMEIRTFIYYSSREFFKAFIDSSFRVMEEKGIRDMVLDLRGNSGGDPICAAYLLSYLEDEPVPYFRRQYGKFDHLHVPIPKADMALEGDLYVLTDALCFSTTGHFTALLKYHDLGVFIGEETGATYTCTGSVREMRLPYSDLILTYAQHRRYSAVVENMDPHRGIIPDHRVKDSPSDIRVGRDACMEFALGLLGDGPSFAKAMEDSGK